MTYYSPDRGVVTTNPIYNDTEVFPLLPGEEFVASKSPTFSTGVKRAASGREVREAYWSAPLYEFKITHEFLRNLTGWQELESLIAFFNGRQGKYGFFYYYDPEDQQVAGIGLGVGNGSQTTFQLLRTRGVTTPYATTEPVYAVWNPSGGVSGVNPLSVSVGGVVQSPTTYTISPWGLLTFNTAPANGQTITWTGCPLYVCRFDQDDLELVQLASLLWTQSKGLTFVSLKP
jgi:uncharacterized protein (TIGR02217 family)